MSDKFTSVGEQAFLRDLCLSPEQTGIAQQQQSRSGGILLGKLFGH